MRIFILSILKIYKEARLCAFAYIMLQLMLLSLLSLSPSQIIKIIKKTSRSNSTFIIAYLQYLRDGRRGSRSSPASPFISSHKRTIYEVKQIITFFFVGSMLEFTEIIFDPSMTIDEKCISNKKCIS